MYLPDNAMCSLRDRCRRLRGKRDRGNTRNLDGSGIHPAARRVVIVTARSDVTVDRRAAVLTVDRIYFLARVHRLVDPGRLHLPARFCRSRLGYMYAFNDFQIRTFLSAFALAIETIMAGSDGKIPARCPLIS